jgi:hypothetical protein
LAKVQELAAASGTANVGSGFSLASRARKSKIRTSEITDDAVNVFDA